MTEVLRWLAGLILGLHGLIHLLGFAAYLGLAQVPGLPYKTTVLGGRVDLGAPGTGVFGVLWGVVGVAFVAVALALVFGWAGWRPVLLGAALLSLLLTGLDYGPANAGLLVNVVILAGLLFAPRVQGSLTP